MSLRSHSHLELGQDQTPLPYPHPLPFPDLGIPSLTKTSLTCHHLHCAEGAW